MHSRLGRWVFGRDDLLGELRGPRDDRRFLFNGSYDPGEPFGRVSLTRTTAR